MFLGYFVVLWEFLGCFKDILNQFKICFKKVSRKSQGCFKVVSMVSPESFEGAPKRLKGVQREF